LRHVATALNHNAPFVVKRAGFVDEIGAGPAWRFIRNPGASWARAWASLNLARILQGQTVRLGRHKLSQG
jgi:hypothetical protein